MRCTYDYTKLYKALHNSETFSVNERGELSKQVPNGVYELYTSEAAFIKNYIGFDNEGFSGVVLVVNSTVMAKRSTDDDQLRQGVFAVRISDIPETE